MFSAILSPFLRRKQIFLSQSVTFPSQRIFTKASASHDGCSDTKPMENFSFSFACGVFAQKSGAIRATSSGPRVDFSSRYCGMKFGENPCETSLDSGSCFPLHFHPSRDFDFPVGRCRRKPRPENRSEMTESCLHNPLHRHFERRNCEESFVKAEPSDIENAPIGSQRV